MLGSAKTNLPLLTLTSWVKGTSSFVGLLKVLVQKIKEIVPDQLSFFSFKKIQDNSQINDPFTTPCVCLTFFLDSRSCDVRPNKYFWQHQFFKTSLPPSRCLFFFKLVVIFYKWDHQHVVFEFQAVASSCSHVPGCSNLTGRARRTILFRWRKTKQTTKQTTKQNKNKNK